MAASVDLADGHQDGLVEHALLADGLATVTSVDRDLRQAGRKLEGDRPRLSHQGRPDLVGDVTWRPGHPTAELAEHPSVADQDVDRTRCGTQAHNPRSPRPPRPAPLAQVPRRKRRRNHRMYRVALVR